MKGSCLCESVRFEITGPCRPVINCHCSQCLKTHGNFAAYTNVARNDLRLDSQESLTWYKSSSSAERGFCNQCGGSLFWSEFDSTTVSVAAGMLDNPSGLKTQSHIFVDANHSYYDIADDLPQYSGSDTD